MQKDLRTLIYDEKHQYSFIKTEVVSRDAKVWYMAYHSPGNNQHMQITLICKAMRVINTTQLANDQ